MTISIPVVDLEPALKGSQADRRAIAREIDRTCTEIGFFTIRGHGVPAEVIRGLRDKANAFFALPLDAKRRAAPTAPATPRGYRAMGLEALSRANSVSTPYDLKEFYHIGRECWPDEPYFTQGEGPRCFVPNLWPEYPPGLGEAAEQYYVEGLTERLMELTALHRVHRPAGQGQVSASAVGPLSRREIHADAA